MRAGLLPLFHLSRRWSVTVIVNLHLLVGESNRADGSRLVVIVTKEYNTNQTVRCLASNLKEEIKRMLSLSVNSLMGEGVMGHTSVGEPLLWYNYFMGILPFLLT